jgi:hypothetical protein
MLPTSTLAYSSTEKGYYNSSSSYGQNNNNMTLNAIDEELDCEEEESDVLNTPQGLMSSTTPPCNNSEAAAVIPMKTDNDAPCVPVSVLDKGFHCITTITASDLSCAVSGNAGLPGAETCPKAGSISEDGFFTLMNDATCQSQLDGSFSCVETSGSTGAGKSQNPDINTAGETTTTSMLCLTAIFTILLLWA